MGNSLFFLRSFQSFCPSREIARTDLWGNYSWGNKGDDWPSRSLPSARIRRARFSPSLSRDEWTFPRARLLVVYCLWLTSPCFRAGRERTSQKRNPARRKARSFSSSAKTSTTKNRSMFQTSAEHSRRQDKAKVPLSSHTYALTIIAQSR